ncbi:S1 RNA-binding domain-containing protein 1 isoform X2 [Cynoglossus semilaevis]|uniref:S1 RNA-binding domain-containing protein 1 isoform X2 n=1 Tax=Cynoglossus semilaevis TaxID=244447 RepID=UPI0007DC99E6|nr:S1 RNA-binding domain-containing protein 1 isoform X2 [Cynoglossus semilaevis]
MMRRPRSKTCKVIIDVDSESDTSCIQIISSDEDSEEWIPPAPKSKATSKAAVAPAGGAKKPVTKRTTKTNQPNLSKVAEDPKGPGKSAAMGKTETTDEEIRERRGAEEKVTQSDDLDGKIPEGSASETRVKNERLSFMAAEVQADTWAGEGTSQTGLTAKKEEMKEEDFTFDEPCLKKQKTAGTCQGKPTTAASSESHALRNELQMNWNLVQVLSRLTCVETWVCSNVITLIREENTVPFMVRYRKEMINHMDADAVRDVQLVYEELCTVAKKTQSVIQTLKKDGVLTTDLEQNLRSCRSADELDHVYSPYKKGSKLTKARKAKALGLEGAAISLMNSPESLDLRAWVKPDTSGLTSVEEVAIGVEHILADMIAKDPETLTYVKALCENSCVTIQSSLSKSAQKDKVQRQNVPSDKKTGTKKQQKHVDIDKFHLYFNFSCNVQRIQPHQTLAINRGESLKVLTVKVNILDRVKSDFCHWCINNRWRLKTFVRPDLHTLMTNAVEDSFKRLVLPFLVRSYRTKLTVAAEKESIVMFVRNLRQRLLACPVRGCTIMGVDPGFRHGCKLAVLSPTSQILHTDVVYPHNSSKYKEADKLRHLMIKFSCTKVVIGNGTACRETESFFADLISKRFFYPLDVSYCITSEAGASIYSVSPEAIKEMPDLDPNLRSAVSIGRRVQDPLAELVKIDPKHIGIGTYQHDVSAVALKGALDSVVQECVSFVGVDINICSETLMRHVAGLNAGRARSIAEWREQNGPFINREQLKQVRGMGPKTFQQCAGFIRINPQTLHSLKSSPPPVAPTAERAAPKKGKGRTCVSKPSSFKPLDQTCVHPESYHVAQRFLSLLDQSADQIGSPALHQCVENKVKTWGVEELARKVDTTVETLTLIIDGLTQPPGFDMRQTDLLPVGAPTVCSAASCYSPRLRTKTPGSISDCRSIFDLFSHIVPEPVTKTLV